MGIFNIPQKRLDTSDPVQAVKQVWGYVTALQEQLEYTLTNLDSSNISEINTAETKIDDGLGNEVLTGDYIALVRGNYSFKAGYNTGLARFVFEVTDGSGNKVIYLTAGGELAISQRAEMVVDGGVW